MKRLLLALGLAALLFGTPPGFAQDKSSGNDAQSAAKPPMDYKPAPDNWVQPSAPNCSSFPGCGDNVPSLDEQKQARADGRKSAQAKADAAAKAMSSAAAQLALGPCNNDNWPQAYQKFVDAAADLEKAIDGLAQVSEEVEPAQADMDKASRASAYYGYAAGLGGERNPKQAAKADNAYADAHRRRDEAYDDVKKKLRAKYGFVSPPVAADCPPKETLQQDTKVEPPSNQPAPKTDSGGGGKTSKSKQRHPTRTGGDTQPKTDTPQPGTDNPTLPKLEETPPTPPDKLRPTDQVMASREGGNPNTAENVAATIALSSDGVAWCTYGAAQSVPISFTPIETGRPITSANATLTNITSVNVGRTVGDRPAVNRTAAAEQVVPPAATAVRTPGPADHPPVASDQPAIPAAAPPTADATPPKDDTPAPSAATPTTDAPPPVTDNPPPADTPSTPDTIVVTIFYKVNEDALKQSNASSELPTQTEKVIFASPDLPGSGNKATADKDFDQNPMQAKSDAHGTSTIRMDAADAAALGMANLKPGFYRVERDLLTNSGLIAETSGKTGAPDFASVTPAGGHIVATTFQIGGLTMTRLELVLPYGVGLENLATYARIVGARVLVDFCRTTKPAMPLGAQPDSLSALNHEVAQATLILDRRVHTGRAVR